MMIYSASQCSIELNVGVSSFALNGEKVSRLHSLTHSLRMKHFFHLLAELIIFDIDCALT